MIEEWFNIQRIQRLIQLFYQYELMGNQTKEVFRRKIAIKVWLSLMRVNVIKIANLL